MLDLFSSDWAHTPIMGGRVPGHLKSLKQQRVRQTYLTESKLPQFLWYSPKGYIHCKTTKYSSWHISALVRSSTTCKLVMILMIHGGPQALLTTSYWTAAHVETGCMCLCVSRPPYCSVSWWPKVGSLTIKWRNCCFEVTTVCSGGRVNFSHQRENQSTLVSYWRFSPAAVCWLCTSSSHADNECPNNLKTEYRLIIWRSDCKYSG